MIAYRNATADDRRFVVSAWSSSYKHAHSAGMIYTDDWPTVMHRQIARQLDAPGIRTLIAYERSDPSSLYGFVVGDPRPLYVLYPSDSESPRVPAVFYCYVKEPYRRAGCARGLLAALHINPEQSFVYACRTAVVARLDQAGVIPLARWNPLIARYPLDSGDTARER